MWSYIQPYYLSYLCYFSLDNMFLSCLLLQESPKHVFKVARSHFTLTSFCCAASHCIGDIGLRATVRAWDELKSLGCQWCVFAGAKNLHQLLEFGQRIIEQLVLFLACFLVCKMRQMHFHNVIHKLHTVRLWPAVKFVYAVQYPSQNPSFKTLWNRVITAQLINICWSGDQELHST